MQFLLRNWTTLVSAILISLAISIVQPSSTFDRAWSDFNLTKQKSPAGERYLIIEITESDLLTFGGPPLARDTLAELMDHLNAAGVSRILIDLAFVSKQNPSGDAKLLASMKSLGPSRLAIPINLSGNLTTREEFRQYTTLVEGRVVPEQDGRIRAISIPKDSVAPNPAIWLSTGELDRSDVPMDLRVDPGSINSTSIEAAFKIEPHSLKDRLVIIAAQPVLSFEHLRIPFSDISSRGRAIAVGAIANDRGHRASAATFGFLGWAAVGLFCIAGLGVGLYVSRKKLIVFAMLLAFSGAIGLSTWFFNFGASARPSNLFVVFGAALAIGLLGRFQIGTIVLSFLRGNLTPEEAWIWNGYRGSNQPALLIDASGGIRQHNESAERLVNSFGSIATSLMPRLGQRENQIQIASSDQDSPSIFRVEWPHTTIPLAVLIDISAQVEREAKLIRELDTDPLTGSMNRRGFDKSLANIADQGRKFAVLYIDLNGFKAVNDTHGHDVGDALLKSATERLIATVRSTDIVARLGGDEFGVIITRDITDDIAKRIAIELERALSFKYEQGSKTIVASGAVGYALQSVKDEPLDQIVKRADQMMYERKRALKRQSEPDETVRSTG